MKPDTILAGFEDTASGSEDDSGPASGRICKAKNGFARSNSGYLIRPIVAKRCAVKQRESKMSDDSSDDDYDGTGSDEDLHGILSKVTYSRKNKKKPYMKRGKRKNTEAKVERSVNNIGDYSFNTVFVVDYDMTLVDQHGRPFSGAKKFLHKLYNFNDGKSTLVLYSHATSSHIEHGLSTHFVEEADYFKEKITDHTMSRNKPVTQVRRVLSDIADLSGPFVIIDDVRSNLDDDQYDITVDVSRHYVRDKRTNKIIDVDYNTILCLLRRGVEGWLQTKKPFEKKNTRV